MSTSTTDHISVGGMSDKWREKIDADVIVLEDGYRYWWPEGAIGCLQSHHLRMIADRLDELNAKWDAIITEELADKPDKF